MNFLRGLGRRFRNLSPAAIREIAAIAVILCIAVAVSLPDYFRDVEAEKLQKAELETDDGFPAVRPEKQGMDSAKLEAAAKHLQSTSALSLLVIRNGELVFEKYYDYRGNTIQSRNNVFSITKSFTSALIGIAIREGFLGGADDPVERYLPENYSGLSDLRWKKITLKHLLTMTPGFCEDLDAMTASSDWVGYTFGLPLKYDPGEEFQYANSSSHLLAVILSRATGMPVRDFAEKYLFRPLGIVTPDWATDPDGNNTGYANLYLRPRDLAKFGWLYHNGGKWGEARIVPEEWVRESTRVQFDFNTGRLAGSSEGTNPGTKAGGDEKDSIENGYGYQWWVSGKSGYHSFSALGYGGQSITVIPELGLEVVITCMPGSLSINDEQREQFLRDDIIASIRK